METSKLRVFVAIAKTESVRKAAEILNLTPSAVSKIFHQVEDELGETLLTPSGRGLRLTPEGRYFAERAEKLVTEIEDLKLSLKTASQKKSEAPLRIATFEVFSTHFLNVLCPESISDRKLVLFEALPGEVEQAVANDRVDVGITYMPVPFPEVEHVSIGKIEMGTFRKRGAFEGMKITDLPFVIPVMPLHGAPTRHLGLDGWPAWAFKRKVAHEVTLMESALELCRQGHCAGYFPTFIIQLHNQKYRPEYALVRHQIPVAGQTCHAEAFIVKRKNQKESAQIKLAAKLLRLGTKVPPGFAG